MRPPDTGAAQLSEASTILREMAAGVPTAGRLADARARRDRNHEISTYRPPSWRA